MYRPVFMNFVLIILSATTCTQAGTTTKESQPQQLYQTPSQSPTPTPYSQHPPQSQGQNQYQYSNTQQPDQQFPQYQQQQQEYQPQTPQYYPQQPSQQYQPPAYQPQQHHQYNQYKPQPYQQQPQYAPESSQVTAYQGQGQDRQGKSQARPWWYAYSAPQQSSQTTAGCQNGDRSGHGRAINTFDSPQQLQGSDQSTSQAVVVGWKGSDQQQQQYQQQPPTPSQQQEPPPPPYGQFQQQSYQPPQQDYYNIVVPTQQVPNYIQNPRDHRFQQGQRPMPHGQGQVQDLNGEEQADEPKPRYPLTPPSLKFKIGLISDLGRESVKDEKKYRSFFKIGHLLLQQEGKGNEGNATVEFDEENEEDNHELVTGINTSGEGFELSTLNVFNGKLYSCDDETGIVYELVFNEETKNYTAFPWVLLPSSEEGFKCEWATVKDDQLWVGSTGVMFSSPKAQSGNDTEESGDNDNQEIHDDDLDYGEKSSEAKEASSQTQAAASSKEGDKKPAQKQRSRRQTRNNNKPSSKGEDDTEFDKTRQNIKKITKDGRVIHVDWSSQYEQIAEALGVNLKKGFVVHEAAAWSDVHQKWLFAPRRLSKQKFDRETYIKTGTNSGIWSDDNFGELEAMKLGEEPNVTTTGFTDIKFIPGTDDKLILALKAGVDESGNKLESTLSVYDVEGKVIMKDCPVGETVFAGVEFL